MSIRELYDDLGSFSIDLKPDTPPDVISAISELDHLYVHAQGIGDGQLERFSDSTLKSDARYAGPILEIEYVDDESPEGGVWRLRGQGMEWHLGDDRSWPAPMKTLTFSADTVATVFDLFANDGIIPDNLSVGTITAPGTNSYTSTFQPDTRALDMFRIVCKALDMHYRVNPDGSVDAGPTTSNEVYRVTEDSSTKLAVAIPKSWGTGSDPIREGVETLRTRSRRDAVGWVSRAVIVDEAYDGSRTIAEFTDRATNPYYGVKNTALVRNIFSSRPASDSGQSISTFLDTLLDENDTEEGFDLDMSQWQLAYGQIAVGDFVHFWDPQAGIEDADNEIQFRGRRIYPIKVRITEADWPTVKGMGIYVRPGQSSVTSADWIDLSPYTAWERTP